MVENPRYYWDACAWISLIEQDPKRFDSLNYVVERAQKGEVTIWTSNFTLAEVYKPCSDDEGNQLSLLAQHDRRFEDFILQSFIERVQVDYDTGVFARQLLRQYPVIKKPQDGIHLASALLNNIDELHTYDRENLLSLSEKIQRRDGKLLKICHPPARPKPKPVPSPLFDRLDDEDQNKAVKGGEAG